MKLHQVLILATSAKVILGDWLGLRVIRDNAVLQAIGVLHAIRLLWKKRLLECLAVLVFTVPFSINGGDKIRLLHHVWRYVNFRRLDLKLPPQIRLLDEVLGHRPGQRHILEHEVMKQKHAANEELCFSIYFPLNRYYNWTRPATLFVETSNADDVEQILSDRVTFPTRGYSGFTDLVGEGLLGLKSGPVHTQHRQLITKFLSEKHLSKYSHVIEEQIEVLLNKWMSYKEDAATNKQFKQVNVQYDLSMLTLDVIMLTAFGCDKKYLSQGIREEDNVHSHSLDYALKHIILRTALPFWKYVPFTGQDRVQDFFWYDRNRSKQILLEGIAKIENQKHGENDDVNMLSELVRMRKDPNEKEAQGLSDDAILDELMTIRGAGHETTSNTLCWSMLLLFQNPKELEKLRQEADRELKGRVCTFNEAKQLKFHQAVVLETLRLYPTVPSFPRECHADVKLVGSGYDLPEGSMILVSQRFLNRNPKYWSNPDEFHPERFIDAELKMGVPVGSIETGSKYSFAPFGAANRSCVGQRLAMIEAVQILSSIVKNVNFDLSFPNEKVKEISEVTLGPKSKEGLRFNISERKLPQPGLKV